VWRSRENFESITMCVFVSCACRALCVCVWVGGHVTRPARRRERPASDISVVMERRGHEFRQGTWPRLPHVPPSVYVVSKTHISTRIENSDVSLRACVLDLTHGLAMITVDGLRPALFPLADKRTVPSARSTHSTAGVSPLSVAAAVATASCRVDAPPTLSTSYLHSPPHTHSSLLLAPSSLRASSACRRGTVDIASMFRTVATTTRVGAPTLPRPPLSTNTTPLSCPPRLSPNFDLRFVRFYQNGCQPRRLIRL
jgi:hypothetical protein